MPAVQPIPEGYHSVTPYLYLDQASKAIDFYKKAFGAKERMRMSGPNDTVGHAELEIGDSVVMLADNPTASPKKLGGTAVSLHIYVDDVDNVFKRALDSGAKQLQPLENKFYGDRIGTLEDPYGHQWSLATHVEEVSPEEMQKRAAAAMPA